MLNIQAQSAGLLVEPAVRFAIGAHPLRHAKF